MNQYPALDTLKALLRIVGYVVIVFGVIASISSANTFSFGENRFDFWLFILQIVLVFVVSLPLLVLAELLTLFQDVARNLSMTRFAAEDISKRIDALYEIEARRERTRKQN